MTIVIFYELSLLIIVFVIKLQLTFIFQVLGDILFGLSKASLRDYLNFCQIISGRLNNRPTCVSINQDGVALK